MNKRNVGPKQKAKILKEHNRCAFCGSTEDLEIHHIVPKVKCGTDDESNLIVLCSHCHRNIHKGNRSELTKLGIERKRRSAGFDTPLIARDELMVEINSQLSEGPLSAGDVIDIINHMPTHGYFSIEPDNKYYKVIEEWWNERHEA